MLAEECCFLEYSQGILKSQERGAFKSEDMSELNLKVEKGSAALEREQHVKTQNTPE